MAEWPSIRVMVLYSPAPREVHEWAVTLRTGGTVLHATQASGLLAAFPDLLLPTLAAGVWGRRVPSNHVLRNGDRVEIYRPLKVDPKVARRERFRRQGVRAAGLFARKKSVAPPSPESL